MVPSLKRWFIILRSLSLWSLPVVFTFFQQLLQKFVVKILEIFRFFNWFVKIIIRVTGWNCCFDTVGKLLFVLFGGYFSRQVHNCSLDVTLIHCSHIHSEDVMRWGNGRWDPWFFLHISSTVIYIILEIHNIQTRWAQIVIQSPTYFWILNSCQLDAIRNPAHDLNCRFPEPRSSFLLVFEFTFLCSNIRGMALFFFSLLCSILLMLSSSS